MALHQIALVGRRMDSILLGVKEFRPDVLHLIYTDITRGVYKPLLAMLDGSVKVESVEMDPYGGEEIYWHCKKIHDNLPQGDTLQYNITEGTKVAAWGCLHAAFQTEDEVYYFSQEGDCINMFRHSATPMHSYITNEEYVTLFGNTLSAYNLVSEMKSYDVITARGIKSFIEINQRAYQRVQHQFRSKFGARLNDIPEEFEVERAKDIVVKVKDGGMTIMQKGRAIFSSDNPLCTRLFFTGRWWEVLVSDAVYRWDLKRHQPGMPLAVYPCEVWRNVEFAGPKGGKTMNELDILVNDVRRLLLIECKSGYVPQECIYKIDSVRDTYGGQHSKSILVSYYPLDANQLAKCEALRVYPFAPQNENLRFNHLEKLPEFLDKVVSEIE